MTSTEHRLPVADEALPDTYARMRSEGPVLPVDLPGGVRVWAVTTDAAIREVLAGDNTRFGKHHTHWAALHDGRVPADWPMLQLVYGEHMLMRDGEEHRRLRRLLSREFTPARVAALRPRIVEITEALVDEVTADAVHGPVDLVPAFAEPLPVAVISELFGIPDDERSALRDWTQVLFDHRSTPEQAGRAGSELIAFLGDLVERKRRKPGPDLTSALTRGHDDDLLSSRELLDTLWLLLVAGHETTVHLLGHAIVAMLANPAQLALAVEADRWPDVVEEALRRTPPVSASAFRYALAPTTLAGVDIEAGDALLLLLGGAATDPAAHGPNATRFDLARPQNSHLAFGHGPHFCLGAPLARLEATIALSTLFHRLPDLTPAIPLTEIPHSPSFLTWGPLSIPVTHP
jgi:2-hydroxy-5-methyl-1-naphthoate 7-hydroxylase